ncbi:MAG: ribose-phosphate pyrophosphokinase-like domain-containing protein, partial [Anaeroplasmataceae bacterium]|nr:ribose-phosphate pyrophosphokinase-like domain-containing protein [Anaeroplasmataceae bacterium]
MCYNKDEENENRRIFLVAILLGKKVKIFSLSANRPLAEEIADSIGVPLSSCDIMHFADGEINVQI